MAPWCEVPDRPGDSDCALGSWGAGKDRVTRCKRVARELEQDELIDRWTLVDDELALVGGQARGDAAGIRVAAAVLHGAGPVSSWPERDSGLRGRVRFSAGRRGRVRGGVL